MLGYAEREQFGAKLKKLKNSRIEELKFLSLAALLMAGAAFAACSSSSDEIIDKQPENPTTPKVYTLVIKASKGGDTTTRALREGTDDWGYNTIDAYWDGTETFEVVQDNNIIGTATAAYSDDGNTNIIATLTDPDAENDIKFYLNSHDGICDYRGQVGLLTGDEGNSISEKYDYAVAILSTENFEIDDNQIKIKNDATLDFNDGGGYAFQAIVKFTLKDKSNNVINATKLNIHEGKYGLPLYFNIFNELNPEYGDITISPSSGTDVIYAALRGVWGSDLTLTANDGDNIYSYSKSSVGFDPSRYYEITVKMNKFMERLTEDNANAVLAGGYKAMSEDEAEELAKLCWRLAGEEGATVYVVYEASGSFESPNVSYVYINDGENTNTGSATNAIQLSALYRGGNTAWFVKPTLADAFVDGNTTALAFTSAYGDLTLSATYNNGFGAVTKGGTLASMVSTASMAKDGNNLVINITVMGIGSGSMTINTVNNTYTWSNASVGSQITLNSITIGGKSITPLPTAAPVP